MNSRPVTLVAIAGTATDIGKTWYASRMTVELRRRGHTVSVRKPVQSFAADGDPAEPTDAEVLSIASGEHVDDISPPHRAYPRAMAPPMAADVLGRPPIYVKDLVGELRWPLNIDVGIVETVGGVRSPLAHDADSAALINRIRPNGTVLVADAGLGTINSVRLSAQPIATAPVLVALNHYDHSELHRRNRDWLINDGYTTVTDVPAACDWLDQLQ